MNKLEIPEMKLLKKLNKLMRKLNASWQSNTNRNSKKDIGE